MRTTRGSHRGPPPGRQAVLPLLPPRSADVPGMRQLRAPGSAGRTPGRRKRRLPTLLETPERPCRSCGQLKRAASVDADGAYCYACYHKFRQPRRACGQCGKLRAIVKNATAHAPDLCGGCYRGPKMTCSRRGKLRPCKGYTKDEPICQACYRRPTHTCCRCGKQRGITAHWPMGPVCDRCYAAVLRSPAECGRCRTSQPLIARDAYGGGICGPCAGFGIDYTCRSCGRAGYPYGHDGCAYCVLAEKVRHLLSGPDGTISSQLLPVAEALAQTDSRSNRSIGSRQARTPGCSPNSSPRDARSATTFSTNFHPAATCTTSGR
jgi:hypothetical protein